MAQNHSQQFRQWLEKTLLAAQPGARLPTYAQMGKQSGLSHMTVKKIVREFEQKGLLVRMRGKGIFAPGKPNGNRAEATPPLQSAQAIAKALLNLISTGGIKYGEALPPVKRICHQFRVAAETVRKAYGILEAKGLVVRVGKTCWVGKPEIILTGRPKKEVFIFAKSQAEFALMFKTDQLAQAYLKLERELATHGFLLQFETVSSFKELSKNWLTSKRMPYGLIFFLVNRPEIDDIVDNLQRLHSRAHKTESMPVTIIDFGSGGPISNLPKGSFVISRGNITTALGRAVAQHVVDTGHKAVNLFYDMHEGFPFWGLWGLMKFRPEFKRAQKSSAFRLILRNGLSKQAPIELARQNIKRYGDKGSSYRYAFLEIYGYQSSEEFLNEATAWESFAALYRKYPETRMWIFSNDTAAAKAANWARSRGIQIPKQLSIIGLENNPQYYSLGITRFEPDWERIGYLMAHAIVGDIPIAKTTKGFIRTPVRAVEKLTT